MLNSAKIIDEAKKQTNLDYFGNPLFMEGFESLVQSINEEAHLNDIGAIEASTASDKELLETYKLVAQNEGIGISFEPAAAITEALKRANPPPGRIPSSTAA